LKIWLDKNFSTRSRFPRITSTELKRMSKATLQTKFDSVIDTVFEQIGLYVSDKKDFAKIHHAVLAKIEANLTQKHSKYGKKTVPTKYSIFGKERRAQLKAEYKEKHEKDAKGDDLKAISAQIREEWKLIKDNKEHEFFKQFENNDGHKTEESDEEVKTQTEDDEEEEEEEVVKKVEKKKKKKVEKKKKVVVEDTSDEDDD
jgi:hypothetical protein